MNFKNKKMTKLNPFRFNSRLCHDNFKEASSASTHLNFNLTQTNLAWHYSAQACFPIMLVYFVMFKILENFEAQMMKINHKINKKIYFLAEKNM